MIFTYALKDIYQYRHILAEKRVLGPGELNWQKIML